MTIHTDTSQLAKNAYDAVFTNHVLEHVPDPNMALTQITLTLRPGGWLVAFFPNGSDECRRANPERFRMQLGSASSGLSKRRLLPLSSAREAELDDFKAVRIAAGPCTVDTVGPGAVVERRHA